MSCLNRYALRKISTGSALLGIDHNGGHKAIFVTITHVYSIRAANEISHDVPEHFFGRFLAISRITHFI